MKDTTSVERQVSDSTAIDTRSRLGVATATLAGFSRTGAPIVDLLSESTGVHTAARSCVALDNRDVGKQVIVVRDVEQPESPIVIGVIQPHTPGTSVEVTADSRNLTVSAQESITLKCGDASITLDRDGKVMIRGRHVVTHASGVNRIRGGSVQLN